MGQKAESGPYNPAFGSARAASSALRRWLKVEGDTGVVFTLRCKVGDEGGDLQGKSKERGRMVACDCLAKQALHRICWNGN